jgi:trans-aconitate methyltransferase
MDKSKAAAAIFNKYAKEYQDKFMNVDLYGDTFDLFCSHIKTENAVVLELACGPGNITGYLLKKRPGFKIRGIDLAPDMIQLAQFNNPTAEFQVMDCREISSIEVMYDAIMCGFCLPYLSKEETVKLFSDASKLLASGGLFYISTMEDDYSESGFRKGSAGDEIYMHYYREEDLVAALKANEFKIIDIRRKVYPAQDGSTVTDLIIIAGKL